ncbi:MAG: type VI secretion system lipoprotein TssJ [Burkholderiales bacterium]|nr:type VI secretion system lipoprotein TssJ [Burkholderiales bacterium]
MHPRPLLRCAQHLPAPAGLLLLALAAAGLGGCASSASGPVDKALELVGLKKPALPEALPQELPLQPRKVAVRLHAAERLNTDGHGRSLAVVARVYKLRSSDAFRQAPYESFVAGPVDRSAAWAQDVIEVRELTLAPGQAQELVETVPREAAQLAVVALFRAPAPQRWRFVFDTKASAGAGITLGLHACAISVAEGQPIDTAPELARVAGVRCQ